MIPFFRKNSDTFDHESLRIRILTFRYYQVIVAGLFFVVTILDLLVDFQAATLVTFVALTVIALIFLGLSVKGVSHRLLVFTNMIVLLAVNQAQLLANPRAFHVLVFWIGLLPLLGAVLLQMRDTVIWALIVLFFILANGVYITNTVEAYELVLYPGRFMVAGLIFCLMIALVAILFGYTNYLNQKRLIGQNERLRSLANEVEKQHTLLKEQNEEITAINSKLEESNQTLEGRVLRRTEELEIKNRRLTEYAFINSHLLRGPLSRVLGLINLLEQTPLKDNEKEVIGHLGNAGKELDDVINKINKAIDSGHTLSRETIRKMRD